MPTLPDNVRDDARQYLELQVRTGFSSFDSLPEECGEAFGDQAEPPDIEAYARAALQDIVIDYRAEQRHWPATTDCDRLDAAFLELEAVGIVARQNFWCCGTCGLAAIDDEIEESQSAGHSPRGYTFYHQQDTEGAVEGRGLYLYYGALDGVEAHSLEIAREIQATLHRHGLAAEWDGSFKNRILVSLDWKRRAS